MLKELKNWIPISSGIILVAIFVYSISRGSTDVILLGLTIKGDVFLSLTAGIITSVVGSIFFLIFLYSLKPNIVISENIGYDHKKEKFLFKVINKSYLFSAIDLDIRLYKMTPLGVSKGNNWRLEKRKINDGGIALIDSKRHGKKYASYAIVFATDENIKDLIEEESTNLMFQISLKHSFSGFTKTYNQYYYHSSNIKYGFFEYGDSTKINGDLCKSVVLSNLCIFVNSKSSLIANKLRFLIHSGFDLDQNPWFCKGL